MTADQLCFLKFDWSSASVELKCYISLIVHVPRRKLQSEVRGNAPGQVDIIFPLLLCQTDVFGPPVSDAGLHRLFRSNGELLGG